MVELSVKQQGSGLKGVRGRVGHVGYDKVALSMMSASEVEVVKKFFRLRNQARCSKGYRSRKRVVRGSVNFLGS